MDASKLALWKWLLLILVAILVLLWCTYWAHEAWIS